MDQAFPLLIGTTFLLYTWEPGFSAKSKIQVLGRPTSWILPRHLFLPLSLNRFEWSVMEDNKTCIALEKCKAGREKDRFCLFSFVAGHCNKNIIILQNGTLENFQEQNRCKQETGAHIQHQNIYQKEKKGEGNILNSPLGCSKVTKGIAGHKEREGRLSNPRQSQFHFSSNSQLKLCNNLAENGCVNSLHV